MNIKVTLIRTVSILIPLVIVVSQLRAQEEDRVISFKEESVQIYLDGSSLKGSSITLNFSYQYSNQSVSRKVIFQNETPNVVSLDAITGFWDNISGNPQSSFKLSPETSKELIISWRNIGQSAQDNYTISYQVQKGRKINFILKRVYKEADEKVLAESSPASRTIDHNATFDVQERSAFFSQNTNGTEGSISEFELVNLTDNAISLGKIWKPAKLSEFFKIERVQWGGSSYEVFNDKSAVGATSVRKMKLTYLRDYYLPEDLTGSILFYHNQDTVEYSITVKRQKPKSELMLERDNKELSEELSKAENDLNNKRARVQSLSEINEILKLSLILTGLLFGVLSIILFRKLQLKGSSEKRSVEQIKTKEVSSGSKVNELKRQYSKKVEALNRQISEKQKGLESTQRKYAELENTHQRLEADYIAETQAKVDAQTSLSVYEKDDLVQEAIKLVNENQEIDSSLAIRWLQEAKEAFDKMRAAEDVPLYEREEVLSYARERYQLIKMLLSACDQWREDAAIQLVNTDKSDFFKKLSNSYSKTLDEYMPEYEHFGTYISKKSVVQESKLGRVFDTGGLEQTVNGVCKNLIHYTKEAFYPLLSRSIIFLNEINLILSVDTEGQQIGTLTEETDKTIQNINRVLKIKMRVIPLLASLKDEDKKFCAIASQKDREDYDYETRASFYDYLKVESDAVKTILFIGYTDLEDSFNDDIRTKILLAD